ncbi:hypothetical protein Hanom_Chr00s113026g01808411 [Helianthus anomalus]
MYGTIFSKTTPEQLKNCYKTSITLCFLQFWNPNNKSISTPLDLLLLQLL